MSPLTLDVRYATADGAEKTATVTVDVPDAQTARPDVLTLMSLAGDKLLETETTVVVQDVMIHHTATETA